MTNGTATMMEYGVELDDVPSGTIAEQISNAICVFQQKNTGHRPKMVTVVLSENTLVVTLHEALTLAERALARDPVSADRLQHYHRELFADSSSFLRKEIKRITGWPVRQATAEVEPASGAIVYAFTTGTMVQVAQLIPEMSRISGSI